MLVVTVGIAAREHHPAAVVSAARRLPGLLTDRPHIAPVGLVGVAPVLGKLG
jgi:hypothetical protein